MELFFRKTGQGPNLVILHGLYGSSDNWMGIARKLQNHFTIYLPDARNHGQSPKDSTHDYPSMALDLKNFLDQNKINKTSITGHSMGGKTAMYFAAHYPEYINSLVIADISPLSYKNRDSNNFHEKVISSLQNINLEQIKSREDAYLKLHEQLKNPALGSFLLKNLKQLPDKTWRWSLQLNALKTNLSQILDGINDSLKDPYATISGFPVLFIKGEKSPYITDRDVEAIYKLFPGAEIKTIQGASHWLHAEYPDDFASILKKFILE